MKTKTIEGIKFYNAEIWVKDELKTIFTMTKNEMEYILPIVKKEYLHHYHYGDRRTAKKVQTVVKRLRIAIDNYDILSN